MYSRWSKCKQTGAAATANYKVEMWLPFGISLKTAYTVGKAFLLWLCQHGAKAAVHYPLERQASNSCQDRLAFLQIEKHTEGFQTQLRSFHGADNHWQKRSRRSAVVSM